MSTASSVPICVIAVKVAPGSLALGKNSPARRRCALDEIGIDDLLAKVQLEERVYRHRCVETWSMIVPWSGFPVRSLVELCKPLGSAKFVVMKTLSKPSVMREQRDLLYPWPYTEGLRVDEATLLQAICKIAVDIGGYRMG